MGAAIATIIATAGGIGLIVALVAIARSGTGDRDDEDAARDFFSEHGHWPDEPPEAAAIHRGEVPYERVDRAPADGPRAELAP